MGMGVEVRSNNYIRSAGPLSSGETGRRRENRTEGINTLGEI